MISAVILTWNSVRYIEACIESFVESARHAGVPLDIFVFDNGSTDGTRDILDRLCAEHSNIALETSPHNTGTTYPRNVGIRRTKGEYVLILDSDTTLAPDAIAEMLACHRAHPEVGIVGPRLQLADGTLQHSCKRFPTAVTKFFQAVSGVLRVGRGLAMKLDRYPESAYENVFFPDYCISACWLVKREVFEKAGVFDERIFYSPEDIDLCVRARQAGYDIAYCPTARGTHHTQRLTYKRPMHGLSHLEGLRYFFRKHNYWFFRRTLYRTMPKRGRNKK